MTIIIIFVIIIIVNKGTQEMDNYPTYEIYSDYEYIMQRDEPKLQCFSCIYTIEDGATQGSHGCADPFSYDPHTVNLDTCNNGSCAKIYLMIKSKYTMVHRGCLFNCANKQTSLGTTECCDTNFCNECQTTRSSRAFVLVNVIVSFPCILEIL